VAKIYVLIYIILAVLIFNLISLYLILKKQKHILSNQKKYTLFKENYISKYVSKVKSNLLNLNYPYKLNLKRYIFIKYILSILIFVVTYLNYNSFKVPFVLFIMVFFIPNYLVQSYRKKEKYILIAELRNIVNSLILCFSSHTTLEVALKQSIIGIKYSRFKTAYAFFVKEYQMNGYKLKIPAQTLENKFTTYEMKLFLSTLLQGENDGNLLESLEKYGNVLELSYFKYLKIKSARNLFYVTFGTILSLVNIVAIVMYPILLEVLNNLELIFA